MIQCPQCQGFGRNSRGGRCRYCRGTGWVKGATAVGATMSSVGTALMQLFWGVVALAILVFIIVAAIQS